MSSYGCRGVCPRSATYAYDFVGGDPTHHAPRPRTATGLPTQQQQTKTTVPQQAYSIYYSCVPGRGGHPAWRVHAPTPSDGPYGREGNVEEEDSLLAECSVRLQHDNSDNHPSAAPACLISTHLATPHRFSERLNNGRRPRPATGT